MKSDVVEFDLTEAAITKMENIYLSLKVKGVDDEDGYNAVNDARLMVKRHRVAVDKRRKKLKREARAPGEKRAAEIESIAQNILKRLIPMEKYLAGQEKIVTDEKKRLQEEEERRFKEKINKRMAQLSRYNSFMPYLEISTMGEDEFHSVLSKIREKHEAEQERLYQEEKKAARIADEQMAERIRLSEERQKHEKEMAEEQKRIDAEKAKIEAAKRMLREEQERIERIEFEKKAAEQARLQAEAEAKTKAEMERLEAEAKAKEEARIEALKPDKEKAIKWLHDCQMSVPKSPQIESEEINDILDTVADMIVTAINNGRRKIETA